MKEIMLITGGTSGLGKEISLYYLNKGIDVVTISVDEKLELPSSVSGNYSHYKCNLASIDDIKETSRLINEFLSKNEYKITNLIHCAGTTYRSIFEEMEWDRHKMVMDVNLNSAIFLTKELLRNMKHGGSVLFIGSVMAKYPHGTSLSYGLSKCGLEFAAKWLAVNLKEYGIRVNCVAPGFIDTEWQKLKPKDQKERISKKTLANRFAEPKEVCEIIISVTNNEYINGSTIEINGGYGLE